MPTSVQVHQATMPLLHRDPGLKRLSPLVDVDVATIEETTLVEDVEADVVDKAEAEKNVQVSLGIPMHGASIARDKDMLPPTATLNTRTPTPR
jgi:hypothetical protein